MELGAIVIPNITYPTIDSLWFHLDGLESCSVVAFSTMGYVDGIFAYARKKGIRVVVPDNIMKLRNTARKRGV